MSMEKDVIEHGVRLTNIEKSLDTISEKLDPVFEYVIQDKERERLRADKSGYWAMVKSGSIAAIVGAAAAWITTKF